MSEALRVFRHIEDDDVRMELRSRIAIHRPGGVVFELGGDPFARRLRRPDSRHARLNILFESIKGRTDGTAMRHPNAIILARQVPSR